MDSGQDGQKKENNNQAKDDNEPTDFKQALQNLTDILVDKEKLKFMAQTLFDAIDTDNEGTIDCTQVEDFCRDFMRGEENYDIDTNFENDLGEAFQILRDNEAGRINLEELSKFLTKLLCMQVENLKVRIEKQVFQRAEEVYNQQSPDVIN